MFLYICKLLRVYDSSLPVRIYLISTSLLKLTSLTTLIVWNDWTWTHSIQTYISSGKTISKHTHTHRERDS